VLRLGTILAGATAVAIVAAVALVHAQTSSRRVINLPSRSDKLPFSQAVLVGNTLYLSGTIGIDPATGDAATDAEKEAHLALDAWKALVTQAGMKMEDIVTVTIYCTDLSLYDKFNTVYAAYFPKDPPARAFIGSGPLLRKGHFEIQGIAVKR
jgi:reactive intermediate/imine deaminase